MSKILIVDDDADLVELLSELLKDSGHEVETETNSLQVFDKVKQVRPDLVLLDLMMPYLDGLDQLKLFKLDESLRNLPVIVVTANAQFVRDFKDPASYGVTDCVFKPFSLTDLLERIEKALRGKPPAAT